jgi:hypothetical protein
LSGRLFFQEIPPFFPAQKRQFKINGTENETRAFLSFGTAQSGTESKDCDSGFTTNRLQPISERIRNNATINFILIVIFNSRFPLVELGNVRQK